MSANLAKKTVRSSQFGGISKVRFIFKLVSDLGKVYNSVIEL